MLRLASDEDVHGDIIEELRRREPDLDIVRVQDVGLGNTPDAEILEWAAAHRRVMVTGDRSTMIGFAKDRVLAGEVMAGLLCLRKNVPRGRVIDDILLVAECYTEDDMQSIAVEFIPL